MRADGLARKKPKKDPFSGYGSPHPLALIIDLVGQRRRQAIADQPNNGSSGTSIANGLNSVKIPALSNRADGLV